MKEEVHPHKGYAYSVKALVAAWVDKQVTVYSDRYFVYFTRDFNAYYNSPTSNPLEIYKALDEESRGGSTDLEESKIERLRRNLAAAVVSNVTLFDPSLKNELVERIGLAKVSEFAPQVWRIKLDSWADSNYEDLSDPDQRTQEFRTIGYSLSESDFEVIIP